MGSSNSGGRSRKCQECRIRKIKCDLKLPECSQCLKIGAACSGPISGNIFVSMDHQKTPKRIGPMRSSTAQENPPHAVMDVPAPDLALAQAVGMRYHNPFLTYPDPSDGVDRLISFYLSVIGRKIISVNPKATWFPSALADPVLFQSTLYSSALHFNSLYKPDDSHLVVFHRAKLLSMVNSRLREPRRGLSDETIAAVALIVYTEVVNGPMTDYSTHMNGLKQMMILRGNFGVSVLQGSLQRMLASSTVFAAIRQNCIEPAPLPSQHAFDITTPCPFAAVDEPINQSQIPSSTIILKILRDYGFHPKVLLVLNDLWNMVSECNDHPRTPMVDWHQADLDGRLLYIEHRFVKYQNVETLADDQIQRSFCVACLIFISIFIREVPGPAVLNDALTVRLQETVGGIVERKWTEAPKEPLLWIAFIGAVVAGGRPERPWFISQASRMKPFFDFGNSDMVEESLKRVLWIHKIPDILCKSFCIEITTICDP